ncbi:MAG: GNAT family N-acetyltransferase [Flavobacteriaceae bacterium]|nr:GNAT family N-acetyltransferase [Flavobacteriaceae bacterium]NNJ80660.1 GNAT family N-acetyltransferase [Flavobacteriaceae bacterium]
MVQFKRADTKEELLQILELQRANLAVAISSEEQKTEGFVTVEHTFDLLDRMNDACPHFIVKSGNKVVGYALSMHPMFGEEIDILRPMFLEIKKHYRSDDFIVMGQVCIDKEFRRKGLFRRLYQEMLKGIQPEFSLIITEVDSKNSRSTNAHFKIGFQTISNYKSHNRDWVLMKLEKSEIA